MNQELREFLNKMKSVQLNLLFFIENNDNIEENFQNLIKFLNDQKIPENIHDFRLLLHLINEISNNHYRNPNFFNKFEKILTYYKIQIKQTFSNFQLFHIFKKNRRMLLLLIETNLIEIDESIASYISKENRDFFYCDYLSPEFSPFKSMLVLVNEFEKYDDNKRKIGENDSKICEIIRKDSVQEFIEFLNVNKISLNSKINNSKYETHNYLILQEPTLIEYASFFGSFEIFQFLVKYGVQLTSSLWNFAVFGNNLNILKFLNENKIGPQYELFELTLKIAFKCHHIEIANYIIQNLISDYDKTLINDSNDYYDNLLVYCFRYCNFFFFPENFINKFSFLYACQYDYYFIVEYLLKTQKIDLNYSIIFNFFYEIKFFLKVIFFI